MDLGILPESKPLLQGLLILFCPSLSLRENTWFKLICGASYQHLPAIRSLVLAYTLAGADCIDVAADPTIVAASREALDVAAKLQAVKLQAAKLQNDDTLASLAPHHSLQFSRQNLPRRKYPWLMVSLNDGDDPHFRKATFNPAYCPHDCPRPCEQICPANAIALSPAVQGVPGMDSPGVIAERCYGCGRCVPVCPLQHIITQSYTTNLETLVSSVLPHVDAVEIHTQIGRLEAFLRVWRAIAPFVPRLKLIAVSCPDGEGLVPYLNALHQTMTPVPQVVIWQTDGRPMSGDIGAGTTRAAIRLAQKVLAAGLPGYVQLAGGTNGHTVPTLRRMGLLGTHPQLAGVAYGSYARSHLSPVLNALETLTQSGESPYLEDHPALLLQGVERASQLVSQLKGSGSSLNVSGGLSPQASSPGSSSQCEAQSQGNRQFTSQSTSRYGRSPLSPTSPSPIPCSTDLPDDSPLSFPVDPRSVIRHPSVS